MGLFRVLVLLLLLPWVFVGLFLGFVFYLGLVGLENEEQRKKGRTVRPKNKKELKFHMDFKSTSALPTHTTQVS